MIDIENQVFNAVANALRATYTGITVYGEYVEAPESFPCVTLVEENNAAIDSTVPLIFEPETACQLMYTANAYSNLRNGKKAQAKGMMDVIDACMRDMGFTRTLRNQVPNLDRTIYRVTARYTRVIQNF